MGTTSVKRYTMPALDNAAPKWENLNMQLEDHIMLIENILPLEVCDDIVKEYAGTDEWQFATVIGPTGSLDVDSRHRNCMVINSSNQENLDKNLATRKKIDETLYAASGEVLRAYRGKFSACSADTDTGYDILKYETGGFFNEHVDAHALETRVVSCSFSLNDDFDGGEFAFFGQKVKYKAPKGAALLFPSSFLYPHAVLPVTKGTRYSVVTWFK